MTPTTLGILFGLLALFFYGFIRIPQRKLIDRVGVYSALFYVYTIETIALVAFLLASRTPLPALSTKILLIVLLIGIIGSLSIASFFKAFQKGKVSIMAAIGATYVIGTIILSMIFFGERPTSLQVFGMGITLLGSLLVSFDWHDIRHLRLKHIAPGLPYAVLFAVLTGLVFFLYKMVVVSLGPLPATLFSEGAIWLFLLVPLVKIRPKRIHTPQLKYALAAGIGVALAAFSYNKGINLAPVSIVASLTAASPLVTAVLARIFLKEHLDINQIVGIGVAVAGVVLISL